MVPTLLAALLFLLSCKSDAGKPETPTASLPSRAAPVTSLPQKMENEPPSDPVIVCFGDSITAGYGLLDGKDSYPATMQRDLVRAGFHYSVVNMGISGETTKDGLARIDHVIARHPELVVVEFGGNDGLRGVPVSESRSNLTEIVGKLKAAGIKVAIAGITLPPQFGADYIHQFNAMYPTVAGKYHVPLLPFLLQDVYGTEGSIQEDGIHPTAQGAKQVAANVEKLITPMLHK